MVIDGISITVDDTDNGLPFERLIGQEVLSLVKDARVWPFHPPRSFKWAGSPKFLFGSVGGCVRYVREDMTRSVQIRVYQELSYRGKTPKTATGPLVKS